MKYISIFLVIVTDTDTSIMNEKLRAYTVMLDSAEKCVPRRKCFQKFRKAMNLVKRQFITTQTEDFTNAVRRLETNYKFQNVYNNMFN